MIGQQLWQRSTWDRVFQKEEINGHNACPTYLYRWTLLRLGPFAVYLHHFVGDDWSRDFHDHPKRFISIGLKGGYIEESERQSAVYGLEAYRESFHAPWIRTFPAEHRHRLLMFRQHGFASRSQPNPLRDCWTLVIVGPKRREWGFWHGDRFIPWREYVDDGELVEKVKSCP